MGIKNINQLLTLKCPECIVKKNLKDYAGKILAIDLSIFFNKYKYNNDDHLEGLTRQILRLLKNKITPLYIFDGSPPEEKDDVIKERIEKRNENKEKQKELEKLFEDEKNKVCNTMEEKELKKKKEKKLKIEIDKIKKRIIRITRNDIELSKKLFDIIGVPYIVSNGEAECLCAALCRNGIVDGCISEDTDILANGGKKFIRKFNASTNYIMEYSLDTLLNNLNISYDQFIDICILCGCDYTCKIMGIGPIGSYKFIKKYETIQKVIELINSKEERSLSKYTVPDNFDYIKAKELFNETSKIDISKYKNIRISKPHIDDLIKFLHINSEHLNKKYYTEINKSLFNYYSNMVSI